MDAPALDVRYFPDAFADAGLLSRLLAEVEWADKIRARRTASFGRPYNYAGLVYPAAQMPALIEEIAARASDVAGHPFDNCLCNLYESGQHSMGFHHDSYDELVPESWVAIASLGTTRSLVFRTRDRAHEKALALESGSILLMNRATQTDWLHGIAKAAQAGPRISLTFRQFA